MKKLCQNCHNHKCAHHGKINIWIDDKRNACESHTTEEMQQKLDDVAKRAGLR